MEFFKTATVRSSEQSLQALLSLKNLEHYCDSMFALSDGEDTCQAGSVWGEFMLRRDLIMGGVRFSMLDCPNALAWTITTGYPPALDKVVIHATINRTKKPKAFVEEIESFLEDLQNGLQTFLSQAPAIG